MSNFFQTISDENKEVLKTYSWIPLIIIGIILIIVSFTSWAESIVYLSKGLYASGTTIITSMVFLTLVKSKQFSNIFNKQLRNIIYCSEHLENRKDIRELWHTTSKAMYEKYFPDLCDIIEDNVENYIPIDSTKYYENYVYKVDISFDEQDLNYINLKERESFSLVSKTTDKVEYKSSTIFEKENYKDTISDYKMLSFRVNKKELNPKNPELTIDKSYKGKKILVIHNRFLNGKNRYVIEKEEVKKYSLLVENTKSHNCSHIFKNYTLEVTHPKELEVKFYENGTLNKFDTKPIREVGDSYVKTYEYEGIMFKNQGTRLIFRDLRK
ncbi:hypothetical protein [Croceitalea rosinachiae]|uniref:SMODS-associating 2TM beta-strand rich effector domain-containing protein n=1 Tax=Croceitalea rosinachiae TaxID=3075596 RepID=A0ABU3ADM1_9FLAO|nr:hypothetical protein [Croceitalea sp. F388]MDT0608084.1 hypothetical protein [Croceitalea sp. F388]